MTTNRYGSPIGYREESAAEVLRRQGLWSHDDIAAFLDLGKSATNEVMASADFPAPIAGDRRYRRYIPDDVIAWALDRADAQAIERRRLHLTTAKENGDED
ncbi:MAG: hypothetical protein PSX37_01930, partial [bacterium]|nr:hypothetical protein [bacterium]